MLSTPHQPFRSTLHRLLAVPELRASDALGRSAANARVSLEFQVGTSLVWFEFDISYDERETIVAGSKLLFMAHENATKTMQLAENGSRSSIPTFWAEFDSTKTKKAPLSIRGVRIRIAEGELNYDVSENYELFGSRSTTFAFVDVYEEHPIPLPNFPDGHHVNATRRGTG